MKLAKILIVMAIVLATVFTLAACGEKACEHTYDEVVTKAATCTEKGEKTLTCSLCGDQKTEELPMIDHTYTESAKAPTCTENGVITYTCSCGDSYTEEGEAATGHDYSKFESYATCTTAGVVTYTCENCSDTYTEEGEDATGVHTYVMGVAELTDAEKAANPNAIGVRVERCETCGTRKEGDAMAVLLNLDFETEETSLLAYVQTQTAISQFLRGDKYSNFGSIQDGAWYNAGNDQVLVNENMGLHDVETFTISADFVLPAIENINEKDQDRFFGWGACGEGSKGASAYAFDFQINAEGKLRMFKNSKEVPDQTAQLTGYTFDDREAWYHIDITVDVVNQEVTVYAGKWSADRTALVDYVHVGTTEGATFQSDITAARPQSCIRFSWRNGIIAMDNFVITVPLAK